MADYFTDSSALVKRYVREIGSAWLSGLFDPALENEVFIVAVTSVEIVAAFTRRGTVPYGTTGAPPVFLAQSGSPGISPVFEMEGGLLWPVSNLLLPHRAAKPFFKCRR